MGYGNMAPPMDSRPQRAACFTCGLPLPAHGACPECTVLTLHGGEAVARPATSPARALAPGDVLEGKWRLEELLGAGGMGEVYRARDIALERDVPRPVHLAHATRAEQLLQPPLALQHVPGGQGARGARRGPRHRFPAVQGEHGALRAGTVGGERQSTGEARGALRAGVHGRRHVAIPHG